MQESSEFRGTISAAGLCDIRTHRNRRPAHLPGQTEGFTPRKTPSGSVRSNGQILSSSAKPSTFGNLASGYHYRQPTPESSGDVPQTSGLQASNLFSRSRNIPLTQALDVT